MTSTPASPRSVPENEALKVAAGMIYTGGGRVDAVMADGTYPRFSVRLVGDADRAAPARRNLRMFTGKTIGIGA